MVSGQCIDLNLSGESLNKENLIKIYKLKTGALITACAEIGAVLSGAAAEKILAAKNYGENIGICFQLVDDILDKETLNLSLLQDKNFETAEKLAKHLAAEAKSQLSVFENNTSFLEYFADFLTSRIC